MEQLVCFASVKKEFHEDDPSNGLVSSLDDRKSGSDPFRYNVYALARFVPVSSYAKVTPVGSNTEFITRPTVRICILLGMADCPVMRTMHSNCSRSVGSFGDTESLFESSIHAQPSFCTAHIAVTCCIGVPFIL